MYYPKKASLLKLFLLLACHHTPSLYAATFAAIPDTISCTQPTLSFPLEDPKKPSNSNPTRRPKSRKNDAVINPNSVHVDSNHDALPAQEEQEDTAHNPTP